MTVTIPKKLLALLGLVLLVGVGVGIGLAIGSGSTGDSSTPMTEPDEAEPESPVNAYSPPPEPTEPESEPVNVGPPDCDAFIRQDKTGVCAGEKPGREFEVAYLDQTLSLKTLDVGVDSIKTYTSIGPRYIRETPNGIFLTISLAITNKTSTPKDLSFQSAIATLNVNGNLYTEDFDASNQSDPKSFVSQAEPIQPGTTQTGNVIFDVPQEIADDVLSDDTNAAILIPEFGRAKRTSPTGGIVLREQRG